VKNIYIYKSKLVHRSVYRIIGGRLLGGVHQVCDEVQSLRLLLDAREHHLGAGDVLLGVL
jgi:hypothetical protein